MKTLVASDVSMLTHFAQPCGTYRIASELPTNISTSYKLTKDGSEFLCSSFDLQMY